MLLPLLCTSRLGRPRCLLTREHSGESIHGQHFHGRSFCPFVDLLGRRERDAVDKKHVLYKTRSSSHLSHTRPRTFQRSRPTGGPPESVAPGRWNAPARRLSAPGTLTILPSRFTCPRAAACRLESPHITVARCIPAEPRRVRRRTDGREGNHGRFDFLERAG